MIPSHYTRDKDNPVHHRLEMNEILSDRPDFGLELCNQVIEGWIRERPDLWLWLMDRWEYTLGKNI